MSSFDGRYAFIADWYDPNAALTRKYQLFYYPNDSTVEMVSNILSFNIFYSFLSTLAFVTTKYILFVMLQSKFVVGLSANYFWQFPRGGGGGGDILAMNDLYGKTDKGSCS